MVTITSVVALLYEYRDWLLFLCSRLETVFGGFCNYASVPGDQLSVCAVALSGVIYQLRCLPNWHFSVLRGILRLIIR